MPWALFGCRIRLTSFQSANSPWSAGSCDGGPRRSMPDHQSRQSFLGEHSEKFLKATTAGVIGLSGGGSHVCQQLAHIGVGNYVIVDLQIIEDTNLNRLV